MTRSPDVSMLWEAVEPEERLRERFGFATPAVAAEWVAGALRDHWGLLVSGCDRLVMSDWNVLAWVTADDRRLVVKWSGLPDRFPRLADVAAVVAALDGPGVPVAAPIPALDGRLVVEVGNDARDGADDGAASVGRRALVGVVPEVEGDLLDVDDPAQVADAGRVLARLHEALAAHPLPFDGRTARAGEQLVHKDFRSANILHDGTRVTAVLDFERLTYDTRVADLAHAAAMLATQYRDWAPTTEEVRRAFISAYEAEASLTATEKRELQERIAAILNEMWRK